MGLNLDDELFERATLICHLDGEAIAKEDPYRLPEREGHHRELEQAIPNVVPPAGFTVLSSNSSRRPAHEDGFDSLQLITEILRLNDCKTFDQVNSALVQLSGKLGFDAFLYGGRFHFDGARHVQQIESNYDPAWREKYDQRCYMQIDPVVCHSLTSVSPLIWNEGMYVNETQRNLREEARMHGLSEGMSLPVHSRNGDVALLSLAIAHSDNDARRHVREMLMCGSLLATLTHEAMRRIIKGQHMALPPKLTKREAEILKWVAGGKSTWEISRLVSISEHGVSYHMRNILQKFDVTNRHQAVAKAVAFGLI
ncbi:autoinducer binding domain-containing protein [Chitiniphilus purpureus]|uniref:Autoinducer binding domain-containing protein n=1 Tax=Chitiniphilus purpureus TaxID=2981137 RepID=A0ABY6DP19_9NEIS|nr:autoinducer binding domain-containing protein [Chitiniphilus sp. CD1]UXY16135.1 autoinducer binding domain-containing protein [Chitiniphilus sp. CD1]